MPKVVEHFVMTKDGKKVPFKARVFSNDEMRDRLANREAEADPEKQSAKKHPAKQEDK